MPPGVPVATMAVGKSGAKNAAIFAVQILAGKYPEIEKKLVAYRKRLTRDLEKKSRAVEKQYP